MLRGEHTYAIKCYACPLGMSWMLPLGEHRRIEGLHVGKQFNGECTATANMLKL